MIPRPEGAGLLLFVVGMFLYGAATGSFLGVVIERVPDGRSIGGRSHCVCGRQLRWWENIPIASWLALRGRARCCGALLPRWYLGLELGLAVAFASVAAMPIPVEPRIALIAGIGLGAGVLGVRARRRRTS